MENFGLTQFFSRKNRVRNFETSEPVFNPWFTRDNPWFYKGNPGFGAWNPVFDIKPRVSPNPWRTRDWPVIYPWQPVKKITGWDPKNHLKIFIDFCTFCMLTIGKTRGFSSSNSDFRFRLRRTSILENPRTHNLQFQTRPCMDTEGTHDIYSIDQPWDQDIKIPGIHSYFEHSACTNNTMDCWFHRFIIMSRLDIWLSHLDHFGSVGVFVFIGMATSCSNLWSCASLQEGVDHTMGQCFHPDEEADLLKELQDLKHVSILQHFHVSLRYIWMIYDWSSYVCFNFTIYIYIYMPWCQANCIGSKWHNIPFFQEIDLEIKNCDDGIQTPPVSARILDGIPFPWSWLVIPAPPF